MSLEEAIACSAIVPILRNSRQGNKRFFPNALSVVASITAGSGAFCSGAFCFVVLLSCCWVAWWLCWLCCLLVLAK